MSDCSVDPAELHIAFNDCIKYMSWEKFRFESEGYKLEVVYMSYEDVFLATLIDPYKNVFQEYLPMPSQYPDHFTIPLKVEDKIIPVVFEFIGVKRLDSEELHVNAFVKLEECGETEYLMERCFGKEE